MTEPVTHVASSVVDSMKGSPMLLAILLTNLLTVGAIVWFAQGVSASRAELITKLIEACHLQKTTFDVDKGG